MTGKWRRWPFAAVFITHDVSLLLTFAHRIAVMYAGQIVEVAPVDALGGPNSHPYTTGLLGALPPTLDEDREAVPIPGVPPSPDDRAPGCRFAPRCSAADAACSEMPPLRTVGASHTVACHRVVPPAGSGGGA